MVIVWRLRGKIFRTVLCYVVCGTVLHSDTRTCEKLLNLHDSTVQEIGWKECLHNDLFCVEWDVKHELRRSSSINASTASEVVLL